MEYIKESLTRYVENKIPPGGFLCAVLENDLKEACARADDVNRYRLFEIVAYCYNHIPSACWGSREAVINWLKEERQ